ncbi:MAG: alginate lyase family protein [Methylobacter sp.]|nr:alginate lyase family protein [Candidatus Methylobacter titanis]
MNANKLLRLFHTIKYLKCRQFNYRIFYILRKRLRSISGYRYTLSIPSTTSSLRLQSSLSSAVSCKGETFTFLNLSHSFDGAIDWNCPEHGKLWIYNLTYFDFLQQEGLSREEGLLLIHDFMAHMASMKDALEPFPVSLRSINWIKFLTCHNIKEQSIDDSLYAQYSILLDNLECHLLGNHLLENGFSLLFGSYYFQDERLYNKAKDILKSELEEQILDDGAHFELSPMYHQIMLFRVLDCINLLQNNLWKQDALLIFLAEKAAKMLGWLQTISYRDGTIPHFNDSTNGIAPTTGQLNDYAKSLNLSIKNSKLSACGYRKIVREGYECVIDVGRIGPDYIPGHAHADTLNFELRIAGKPFVVDAGLSTYEIGKRRDFERGTAAHNTVVVNGQNSSDVWGGFRVAERAGILALEEGDDRIKATHNGYKKLGISHTRTFEFYENKILISDQLNKNVEAKAYLHFHPNVSEETIKKHILLEGGEFEIKTYEYAEGFNKQATAKCLEIDFQKILKIEITL